MFCHQCGSVVRQDMGSCGACGAPVRASREMETQPVPVADPAATLRMPPMASVPVPAPRQASAVPPQPLPTGLTPAKGIVSSASPGFPHRSNPATTVLLGGIAVLMVAGWGAYQWSLRRALTQAATPSAVSAAANAATQAINAAAPALEAAGVSAAPAPPADASPAPAPNSGVTLAQLTAARRERDAAIEQRDAALDQVRELREDLARGRTSAPPTISATDGARLAQLQRERDTLRYVAGSKKLLVAQKVIESHLYLLPPPPDAVVINVAQTTEITLEAKAFGLNKIKDLQVIPSSVWEDTDYKFTITGNTTAKFTILKPESFRTFAKYFVILLND